MSTRLESYTIGWICAIETEYVVACELLDEEYEADKAPKVHPRDKNVYHFGRISRHNIVIACLPKGRYGITSAAVVAERMQQSFSALRFCLLVGIAGGAPSKKHDIRLGDVVVSVPTPSQPGVIQYDFGKAIENHEFKETGYLAPPPDILLNALSSIITQHKRKGHKIAETIESMLDKNKRLRADYRRPDIQTDTLYETLLDGREQLVARQRRRADEDDPVIHYGLIASANQLMKNRTARNALVAKYEDVLCFEMEAAGLMNTFPCLVIRGICDYSDSFKNDIWQGYAAATAAAYAKELLDKIPCQDVQNMPSINEGNEVDYPARKRVRYENYANTLNNSTNYGISANIVYGGIHQHHSLMSNVLSQSNSLGDNRSGQDIGRADIVIRNYYTSSDRLKIVRLSGKRLSLEECYINLAIVDRADAKKNEVAKLSSSLETRLKLEADNPERLIPLEKLFESRKADSGSLDIEPRRIFIEGRAGVGKTTLCKKIVYEFLNHRLGRGLFDRLLWIPLRRLKSKSDQYKYKWLDLLKDTHSPLIDDWDEVTTTISKQLYDKKFLQKTLFLFDGLDEISYSWRRDDSMYEFLADAICDLPNVIITSRPQANTFHIGKFHMELETLGFSPDQIDIYLQNCVKNLETVEKMKRMIAQKPLVQGLLRIPVQLDAFCCVWPDGTTFDTGESSQALLSAPKSDNFSTMTNLYQLLVSELCRKDLSHLKKELQPERLDAFDVDNNLRIELNVLCELAFQGLVSDVVTFTPLHRDLVRRHLFQRNFSEDNKTYNLERLSFLRTSDIEQDPSKSNYHFLHLTFQEFFAAKHFVRHWRTDTDLTCLNLTSLSYRSGEKMSPFKFLQSKKYDPRFNIFWRFVTGLVQSQQDEHVEGGILNECDYSSKDVTTFFDELHKEPVDLLGFTHCRLIMYCFSEVIPHHTQQLEELLEREKEFLREGLIREAQVDSGAFSRCLGSEAEFPESILQDFLYDEHQLPYTVTLGVLRRRKITAETLKLISDKMRTTFTVKTLRTAIDTVLWQWNTCPPNVSTYIMTSLVAIFRDKSKDGEARKSAAEVLSRKVFLSKEAVEFWTNALIDVLKSKDEDVYVRRSIAEALVHCALRAKEVSVNLSTDILIDVLNDKDEDVEVRSAAAEFLGRCAVLSEGVSINLGINTLAIILKDKGENTRVRKGAARGLTMPFFKFQKTSFNPQIDVLINILKDKDENIDIRYAIFSELQNMNQPDKIDSLVINILIDVLKNKAEDHFIRGKVIDTLKQMSLLPQETINLFIDILKNKAEGRFTRGKVIDTLKYMSLLPQETINLFIDILKNKAEDRFIRGKVIDTLKNMSLLPQETINLFIDILKDKAEDRSIRVQVIDMLKRMSPLPQEIINLLIDLLENEEEDMTIRRFAAATLNLEPSLSSKVADLSISIAVYTLKNNDFAREDAIEVLRKRSSLPQETINCLVCILKDQDKYWLIRYFATVPLKNQSLLPQETVITLIKALVHVFWGQDEYVYNVLHRHDVYSIISSLDDEDWQRLCSSWLVYGHVYQISCYEFEGSFHVWVGGKLYIHSANLPRTPDLLRIMLETRERYLSSNLSFQAEDDDSIQSEDEESVSSED